FLATPLPPDGIRLWVILTGHTVAHPLQVPIAQLGLTRAIWLEFAGDAHAIGQTSDIQRITAPQHQVRNPPALDGTESVSHSKNLRGYTRQPCQTRQPWTNVGHR